MYLRRCMDGVCLCKTANIPTMIATYLQDFYRIFCSREDFLPLVAKVVNIALEAKRE
jgi:hypothetical protein